MTFQAKDKYDITYKRSDKFYEIMYTLKEKVSEAAIKASFEDYKSVIEFYKYLKELVKHVHPYCQNDEVRKEIMPNKDDPNYLSIRRRLFQISKLSLSKTPKAKMEMRIKLKNLIDDLELNQMQTFMDMRKYGLELPMDFRDPSKAIRAQD